MANYGIPYQGSKDKIVHKIASLFPEAENFYDLFGGGFSVSHFMLLHKKYKVHYNEIEDSTVKLIQDSIKGKYNYNVFKPKWITPEEFKANLNDAYIRIIWSFGNNQRCYLFGEKRIKNIRSLHQAVVFDEFDDNAISLLGVKKFPANLSIRGRRLYCRKIIVSRINEKTHLKNIKGLEQLERLEGLEGLQRLEMTSLSYDQVQIKPNSIIYCDPPYKGTARYLKSFDHDKFWEWVRKCPYPVFVSEYSAPNDIKTLMAVRHQKTNSQTPTKSVEKLYGNNAAAHLAKRDGDTTSCGQGS